MKNDKDNGRFDGMFPDQSRTPSRKKRTPKKDLEGAVVHECLTFLRACEQVVYIERRNTGAVQFEDGGFIRFGFKGAADIWCLISKNYHPPRHVEIECKRRDGKGRLSPDQKMFQNLCGGIGVLYFVVTSAEDLAEQLQKAGLLA